MRCTPSRPGYRTNTPTMKLTAISLTASVLVVALGPNRASAAQCPNRWAPVASQYKDAHVCIDTNNIRAVRDLRSVPWMIALDGPKLIGDIPYRSVIHLALVNCESSKVAISESQFFSGAEGTGDVVRTMEFSESNRQWEELPSPSGLKQVCAARLAP